MVAPLAKKMTFFRLVQFLLMFSLISGQAFPSSNRTLPDSVIALPPQARLQWIIQRSEWLLDGRDNEKVVPLVRTGEVLAIELGDKKALMLMRSRLARIMSVEGFYEESLALCYAGMKIALELGDTAQQWEFLIYESNTCNQIGEHDRAIAAAKAALKLEKGELERAIWPLGLNSLAEAYRYAGEPERALPLYQKALDQVRRKEHETDGNSYFTYAILHNNLAHTYLDLGNYEMVEEQLEQMDHQLGGERRFLLQLEADLCRLDLMVYKGQTEAALKFAQEGMQRAIGMNSPKYEVLYAQWLFEQSRKAGDYEQALEYRERIADLNEKSSASKARIQMALFDSEMENRDLRNMNKFLEIQSRTQQVYTWSLSILLLLLAVLLYIQFRNFRKVRRLNRLLSTRNKQLDAANKEINGLVGIVAHDLKAPLTKSIMLVDMIKDTSEVSPQQDKLLSMIRKASSGGGKLIQDLLEISSLEGERSVPNPQRCDLRPFLQEMVDSYREHANRKGIDLDLQVEDPVPEVVTDPHKLQRVIDNILSNALKFTPAGKSVRLSLSSKQGQATISIRDQGPGISPEDQKKMFGKFQKLSARPTGGESSHGLGLSIVRSLVTRLHLEMEFESELGKGTEFRFHVPVDWPGAQS
jgi:signal transduction histidine kinase